MVETIGNRLRAARLQRKISLDDAAHLTKISASRLSDLESDVYTNFPNIAYARGFLLIYSNFLDVDAAPHLNAFEGANTFGLDDYQYLSETPVAQFRVTRRRGGHYSQRRKRRLVATTLAAAVLTLGGFAWYLMLSFQRLGNLEQLTARQQTHPEQPAATPAAAPGLSSKPVSDEPEQLAAAVATGGAFPVWDSERTAAPTPSSLEADREAAAALFNGAGLPNRLLPTGTLPETGPYANLLLPASKRADAEAVVPETVANRTGGSAGGEAAAPPAHVSVPRTTATSATTNRTARAAGVAPRAAAISVANH